MGGELLLERGLGHRRSPRARWLTDLDVRAVGEEGIEDAVVALGEQPGVVVRGVTVHHEHVRLRDVPRLDAVHEALPDQASYLDVVETHVGPAGGAALGEPVVVDHLHALGVGVGLDGGAAARVERVDDQHAGALGDVGLGLGLHGGGAALGVVDLELGEARGLEGLGDVRGVERHVPSRRGRVGEQDPDQPLALGGQRLELGHGREVAGERGRREGTGTPGSRGRRSARRRLLGRAAGGEQHGRRD